MISREDLYKLVWSKPMTKVGEELGVSGSYMTRVCAMLNVPRPGLGYWAKLAVGKAPPPTPLPEARPGDTLFWSQDGQIPSLPKPQPPKIQHKRGPRILIPKGHFHALIQGAKEHFENTRPSRESTYLKPYKRLLVDITSSKACLDKALGFANELYNALESAGYRVTLAPSGGGLQCTAIDEREKRTKERGYYHPRRIWSPDRPTVVYLGSVAIGLSIIEMSEEVTMRYVNGEYIRDSDHVAPKQSRYFADRTWTTTQEQPTGRIRLLAFSPYRRVGWVSEWEERREGQLASQIKSIVRSLEVAATELVQKIEEAERQAEIAHQKWLIEEDQRRRTEDKRHIAKSFEESRAELEGIIEKWGEIVRIEEFLMSAEERLTQLPEDKRPELHKRLQLARELLGSRDPLDFLRDWKTPGERYSPAYRDEAVQP